MSKNTDTEPLNSYDFGFFRGVQRGVTDVLDNSPDQPWIQVERGILIDPMTNLPDPSCLLISRKGETEARILISQQNAVRSYVGPKTREYLPFFLGRIQGWFAANIFQDRTDEEAEKDTARRIMNEYRVSFLKREGRIISRWLHLFDYTAIIDFARKQTQKKTWK